MPQLPVSVIIPTYNRGRVLKRTVEYVSRQAPAPLEVIVIDQSEISTEPVSDCVAQSGSSRAVRLIRQQPPNAQAARNRGIIEARGEVLLFLDDDIECEPGLVSSHWENYDDPNIAAVSGMILEPGQDPAFEFPGCFFAPQLGWGDFPLNYGQRADCINLSSCNCSIRREIALAVGGFDENFVRTLFDDSDFAWRVHQYCRPRGLRIIHDPRASLIHLRHPSGGKRPGKRNDFIIADAARWQTWLYFYLQHWGREAFLVLARRYRWWIWHRRNVVKPWWLAVAHWHLMVGIVKCAALLIEGPKLLTAGDTPC